MGANTNFLLISCIINISLVYACDIDMTPIAHPLSELNTSCAYHRQHNFLLIATDDDCPFCIPMTDAFHRVAGSLTNAELAFFTITVNRYSLKGIGWSITSLPCVLHLKNTTQHDEVTARFGGFPAKLLNWVARETNTTIPEDINTATTQSQELEPPFRKPEEWPYIIIAGIFTLAAAISNLHWFLGVIKPVLSWLWRLVDSGFFGQLKKCKDYMPKFLLPQSWTSIPRSQT
eukprot:TRINITY_DN67107_c10_g6_i2.p1 TRINITY_DN67107_c10_g6~~TRINITY_DN67107_c10_g6_i2.p1  ORF type:complete len:232 (+),score=3.86 TRINITY_DN67107_c10_g6_i2:38-733(+)